jgi:hypothetical protein
MAEGEGELDRPAGRGSLHEVEIRVTSARAADFHKDLPRPRRGDRHLAKLGRFLPGDKLKCFHSRPQSVENSVDVYEDVPWPAEYLVVPVWWRIDYKPRVLHPANKLADRDLSLQTRERAAEAEVDAAAVAKMLVVHAF